MSDPIVLGAVVIMATVLIPLGIAGDQPQPRGELTMNETTLYMLPDGFTVEARGTADSDWNGFDVPILSSVAYNSLRFHLEVDQDRRGMDDEPYVGSYVNDGKVTPGWYCDGLQWIHSHIYEPAINHVAGATLCWYCAQEDTHPIHE